MIRRNEPGLSQRWRLCSYCLSNDQINLEIRFSAWLSLGLIYIYICMFKHIVIYLYRIMYVLEWRTVSVRTRALFLYLFPELRSKEGNKHKNNTQVSAETVRHEGTYIVLFLTRHCESIKSINDDINDDLYTSSLCFTRSVFVVMMISQLIADDVTIKRKLWRNHVNSDI